MNRIVEIINKQFEVERVKLEHRLELLLNDDKMGVEERVEKAMQILDTLSVKVTSFQLWTNYINQNNKEQ